MLVSEQTLTYPCLLNTKLLWLFFISLFLVHQYPDPPFIPFLCACTPCLPSSLALLIPHHVWLCLFAPAPYNKTMMDLITPVTHTLWQPVSLFFFLTQFRTFSMPICLSFPSPSLFFPPSLVYDEQENMLTDIPSVPLIKTLAVMGAAPGTGQQGPVSVGLSSGMANGCHGLVQALHDFFSRSKIHSRR